MSMVVQHNLTAMNSNRMLGVTTSAQAKSTEKLSSGYKINRAADDAAGLSISEKMRKQIRGLTQASANAQDGISTVQTAEGALTEVHDMLQRMNELAVKAANGTQSESDRQDIQSEIDQLVTEIDRVSTTTKFNETYLLKGRNADGTAAKLTYDTAKANLGDAAAKINVDGAFTIAVNTGLTKNDVQGAIEAKNTIAVTPKALDGTSISAQSVTVKVDGKDMTYYLINSTQATSPSNTVAAASVSEIVDNINDKALKDKNGVAADVTTKAFSSMDELTAQLKKDFGADVKSVVVDTESTPGTVQLKVNAFADLNDAMNVSLHVGADSAEDNKIDMSINMMSARGLGVNGLDVTGDTDVKATKAIDTIADAIAKVSSQRSSLGAAQNRLEHTIKNLDNVVENTTSAESQIRDTDMATEMVNYSKNQILAQAGQSMLAQANQANQGVLSLLQ
jgi:flagellin